VLIASRFYTKMLIYLTRCEMPRAARLLPRQVTRMSKQAHRIVQPTHDECENRTVEGLFGEQAFLRQMREKLESHESRSMPQATERLPSAAYVRIIASSAKFVGNIRVRDGPEPHQTPARSSVQRWSKMAGVSFFQREVFLS
jgi:hypothetical protein